MKSKILLFILALCLCIPAAIGLAGCKGNQNSKSQDESKYYVVTIHSAENSSLQIKEGEVIPLQAEPSVSGMRFDGWFANEECTIEYDFATPVTKNTEIWAKFTKLYTVSFVRKDGDAVASSVEVEEGATVARPDNPSFSLIIFDNWYVDASMSALYDFSSPVTSNLTIYANFYEDNLTLYEYENYVAVTGCYSSAQSVVIPAVYNGKPVTNIGNNAFGGCSSLISIEIPTCVTSIGDNAFLNCFELTKIEIPAGVISIGEGAFDGCRSLTDIEIPAGVTIIGRDAFRGCSSLVSINIPEGVTSIGGDAFRGCSSLTNINIPANVISIGDEAFNICDSLTEMYIQSSIIAEGLDSTGDGGYMFFYVSEIYIRSDIISIGHYVVTHYHQDGIKTVNGVEYNKYVLND